MVECSKKYRLRPVVAAAVICAVFLYSGIIPAKKTYFYAGIIPKENVTVLKGKVVSNPVKNASTGSYTCDFRTEYAESKTKGIKAELSLEECINLIESKKIQIGPNPFILERLNALSDRYDKKQDLNSALYFYELQYDLTLDEKVLEKIKDLQRIIKH